MIGLVTLLVLASSARAQDADGDGSPDELPGSLVTIEAAEGGLAGVDLAPALARAHRALRPCARARGRAFEAMYRDEVRVIWTIARAGAAPALTLEELPHDPGEDPGPPTAPMRAWRACVERVLRPLRFPRAASAGVVRARVIYELVSGRAPEADTWRQPSIRWTTTEPADGMAREVARRRVHGSLSAVRACYLDAVARYPALAGTISVTIAVADGRVVRADARADVRGLARTARCMERALAGVTMPGVGPGEAAVRGVLTLAPPPTQRP